MEKYGKLSLLPLLIWKTTLMVRDAIEHILLVCSTSRRYNKYLQISSLRIFSLWYKILCFLFMRIVRLNVCCYIQLCNELKIIQTLDYLLLIFTEITWDVWVHRHAFPPFCQRETIFMTSCLPLWTTKSFWNRSKSFHYLTSNEKERRMKMPALLCLEIIYSFILKYFSFPLFRLGLIYWNAGKNKKCYSM